MDYVALVLALSGVWLIGSKKRVGFLLLMACSLAWGVVAIQTEIWGLLIETSGLFILNTRAYFLWGQKTENL